MLSSHLKSSQQQWLHNKSRVSKQKKTINAKTVYYFIGA